jgi:hypothetical protein
VNAHSPARRRKAKPSVRRQADGRVRIAFKKVQAWPPSQHGASASKTSLQIPARAYQVTLYFADIGGRLECVRFEMGADLDAVNGPDPNPVTATTLRAVPLRELIDTAVFEQTKALGRWAREVGPTDRVRNDLLQQVATAEASLGQAPRRAPGRPPEYSELHFLRVANAYTKACMSGGRRPRKAVADLWHVSPSTAAKWVARARRMGLLPATERGRPRGGEPPDENAASGPTPQTRRNSKLREIEVIEEREAFQLDVLRRHEAWLAEFTGLGQTGKEGRRKSVTSRSSARARKGRAGLPTA